MGESSRMSDQELLALVEAKNDHIEVLEQRIRDIKLALNEAYEKGCHESRHQEAQQAESPQEPLTDEQIEQMEADALTKIPEKYWAPLHDFARAIERTLATRWGVKLKGDS